MLLAILQFPFKRNVAQTMDAPGIEWMKSDFYPTNPLIPGNPLNVDGIPYKVINPSWTMWRNSTYFPWYTIFTKQAWHTFWPIYAAIQPKFYKWLLI
ncbi:MAG: hypothetical protein IPO27_18070 [Bacteroidetes bacterium]|nr:hypothetical protein [Bacteroidota bacterium]